MAAQVFGRRGCVEDVDCHGLLEAGTERGGEGRRSGRLLSNSVRKQSTPESEKYLCLAWSQTGDWLSNFKIIIINNY